MSDNIAIAELIIHSCELDQRVDQPRDAHSFRYRAHLWAACECKHPVQGPATPSGDPATEVNHDFITPLGYYDDADQMLLEQPLDWKVPARFEAKLESYDLLEAGTWVSVTTPVVCVGCLGDEERRLKYEWGTGLGIPSDIKPQRPHRVGRAQPASCASCGTFWAAS